MGSGGCPIMGGDRDDEVLELQGSLAFHRML
jgi:hypothetical protein